MEEIRKIVKLVAEAVRSHQLSHDDYELLLLKSGISEEDASNFFVYAEDGFSVGIIVGISKSNLTKKLTLDNKFSKNFIKNLPKFLVKTVNDDNLENDEVIFQIKYNSKYRRIYVNETQVKKFNMGPVNSRTTFEDVFNNPNQSIKIKKGRGYNLVNSFGFKDNARKIFFSVVTDTTIMLNNPIKRSDLKKLGMENITFEELFPYV